MIQNAPLYLLTLAICLTIYELLRRYKVIAWAVLVGVPIIFGYHWVSLIEFHNFNLFEWVKVYSLFLGSLCIMLMRFTNFNKNFLQTAIYSLLLINIFEAIVVDFLVTKNFVNVFTGLLIMASAPFKKWVGIDLTTPYRDLFYPATFPWIIGHTLWHGSFALGNYPDSIALHLALYSAPILITILRKGHWLQARAFTLTVSMYSYFIFQSQIENLTPTNPPLLDLAKKAGLLGLIFMIGTIAYNFYKAGNLSGVSDRRSN